MARTDVDDVPLGWFALLAGSCMKGDRMNFERTPPGQWLAADVIGERRRIGTVTAVAPTTTCSLGEASVNRDDLRALAVGRGFTAAQD
jgi:hypothetical protein